MIRRRPFAALAAAVMLAGCAHGRLTTAEGGIPTVRPNATLTMPDPQSVLLASLDKIVHWPDRLTMRYVSRLSEPDQPAQVVTGKVALAGALSAQLGVVNGDDDPIHVRYVDGDAYISRLGARWIKVAPKDLADLYDEGMGQLAKGLVPVDPRDHLRALLTAADLRYTTSLTMDGLTNDCYAGTVQVAKAAAADDIDRTLRAKLEYQARRVGFTSARVEMCVGRDGFPRRVTWQVPLRTGKFVEVTDLRDYGTPFTVQAPPARQVAPRGENAPALAAMYELLREGRR